MLYHDSRSSIYRTPLGAGMCLSRVTLRLSAEEGMRVFLRLWWEEQEQVIEMYPVHGSYEAEITLPDHPGNLWYYFIIRQPDDVSFYYGNARDRQGGVGETYSSEPPAYQISVYDPAYETPAWMRNSILYQIMVDRFCSSRPVSEKPAPYMGYYHDDWSEPPVLRRDSADGDNEANDFFGGDLQGVTQKLGYLEDLGVTALYFNPIFKARSNHKYDTGDYLEIDPSFGDEDVFRALTGQAKARGMHVLLDGVFSHTGADSRYFNLRGSYDSVGAYQSQSSPYASWYSFERWPDRYLSWWGFSTLPNVREMDESFLDFIIRGDDAVCAHWIRAGASGWRLDVADELPLAFLRLLRARVKREDPDACLLGEVWEDASNKLTYGEMRNYSTGDTLDSVMNYPLRDGLISFMTGHTTARQFARMYDHLKENYAPPFFYSLMNMLGSHDKPRIIDMLSGVTDLEPAREQRHARTLTRAQYRLGRKRFIAAWQFVCALPGMPCLYYADEAGQTGMADPFCRGTYPWGQEDKALTKAIRKINHARLDTDALRTGALRLYAPSDSVLIAARYIDHERDVFGARAQNGLYLCVLNRSGTVEQVTLAPDDLLKDGFTGSVKGISAVLVDQS